MPEITITIGGRPFEVVCQAGEEHFLQAAAKMLDIEAGTLMEQMGRLPETRMLLMAGLMLADKTAGLEGQLRAGSAAGGAAGGGDPTETGALAALAKRAEALADRAEKAR